ncbi:putative holin-like toxin [Paenibacillus sp. JJ-100]|nr:putative holin-like toxin [Paenibacillus sp. JJ-100]
MEIKDVLTLMISFAGFTVTLIGLIVTIVIALNNQSKKK